MGALRKAFVLVGAAVLGIVSTAAARGVDTGDTGPALSEPPAALAASLTCVGDPTTGPDPVLLVHGTASGPNEFAWNWVPALTAQGAAVCTVAMPVHGLVDIQQSAEYVVYGIRTLHATAGRRIDVVGHSQGGMIPRWALRFWPDTRSMVDDVVGIAASNHGTPVASGFCVVPCFPSAWQQAVGSAFLDALNKDVETWAGISYTSIYTRYDEIVTPNLDESGPTSLHTGEGLIANIAIQDLCPLAVNDHIGLGTYDPIAWAVAWDAMTHDGTADPARVGTAACTQLAMPGVNMATFATDYAATLADLAANIAASPKADAEPALRCYVTASCEAASAAAPAAGGEQPAPRQSAAEVQGRTLAATGIDMDGRLASVAGLVVLALAGLRASRRLSL